MVNKLIFILLFFSFFSVNAQYLGKAQGKTVTNGASSVIKVQESDIPPPSGQPTSEFNIYKFVHYGDAVGLDPDGDTMTLAEVKTRWQSDDMVIDGYGSRPGPDLDDSLKIVWTVSGWDTIRQISLLAVESDKGGQINGDLWLNGENTNGDTVTVLNRKVKILVDSVNWDKTAGGKWGGFGGKNRSSLPGNNPVSGCLYGPDCTDSTEYYEEDRGFTVRFSCEVDDGGYTYEHDMWFPSSCGTIACGQHYVDDESITPGQWNEYNMRIILNSTQGGGVGDENGYLEIARNDTVIMINDTIMFRRYDDIHIDFNLNSVITAGNYPGRTNDTWMWKDDEIVWRESSWSNAIQTRNLGDVISTPQLGSEN